MPPGLPILNLDEAKFECTFGRGCDGVCCREGRPFVFPEEIEIIAANLDKFLPLLRPEARAAVERGGYLVPRRRRLGQRVMRVAGGWCVFFHRGCVLHEVGMREGDKYRYKPSICALFPIQQDNRDRWYVRQKGYKGERWALSCLDPRLCAVPAAESLRDEIALARRFDDEQKASDAGESGGRPGTWADGPIVARGFETEGALSEEETMAASGLAGEWETDFGKLELQVQGGRVTGTYGPNDGRIEGTVAGNVVQGTWRQNAPGRSGTSWGTFVLNFSADGRSFTGRWSYCDDYAPGGGTWFGRR